MNKEQYRQSTLQIMHQSHVEITEPQLMRFMGRKLWIHPRVFSPKHFEDTLFFTRSLKVCQGEQFLEIGPGSGAIAVTAAKRGAIVSAVDIHPAAVQNTRANAALWQVNDRVSVYEGDLYTPLYEGSQFDTIFWNTPFAYVPKAYKPTLEEKAVMDPGYEATERFISGARDHLKPGGRLMIGFSSTLGSMPRLRRLFAKYGFIFTITALAQGSEGGPVQFELIEAHLQKEKD